MNSVRGRLLASTMVAGAAVLSLGFAGQAAAQASPNGSATSNMTNGIGKGSLPTSGPVEAQAGTTTAADANGRTNPSDTSEVVVTGSRISSPNMKSISPVTAVSGQDFKVEGITRVEDLLNQLPQVFADQGSAISNGANGIATVDLRGLGANRTLVLIDGRRLINGDANDPAADINFIPLILIDRVDVDTGGASAVYGSDALAGVVNFITRKNFEGVSLDVQWAGSEHDNNNKTIQGVVRAAGDPVPTGNVLDGQQVTIQGLMGINSPDGKGNLTAYATYRSVDAILQANRDYSACTLNDASQTTFGCGGSGTAAAARIGNFAVAPGGTFIPRAQNPVFNFGPYNYYERPDVNYKLGAMGHYEINKAADVYTQLMFMDDNSVAQIAPGGIFGATYSINCNNAFASAAQLTALCGANAGSTTSQFTGTVARRNVEGGGRASDFRHTDYRGVVGIRGDLGNDWNYDLYGMYSTVVQNQETTNYFSIARIKNALQAVKNANGQIVCANGGSDGCVPYNLFTPGGVTPAALNYLQVPAFQTGSLNEQIVEGSVTGKLGQYGIQSPFADEGVGVAFGGEYRKERINFQTDLESSSGDLSGTGGASPPVNGSFDVYELYGEARVPLVTNKPFIDSLNFEAGYRFSQYSTNAGNTDTYKAGLDYSPIHDLRFRASYQHAVRAPNIDELFTPQAGGLGLVNDICAGPAVNGLVQGKYTAAQCARTGVTAAEFGNIEANPAAQYNTIGGGNPNLTPEISNTYSAGFIYSPHYITGLSVSADFFNISVDRVIGAGLGGADNQLQQCALTGSSAFCGTIHRDQATAGTLFLSNNGYVLTTQLNGGELQSEGVDITADYKVPLSRFGLEGFGTVDFNYLATYNKKLRTKPTPGGAQYDCAGLYGSICGTPNPYYRHKMRLTWNTPFHDLQISGQWRYFGGVKADGLSDQGSLTGQSDAGFAVDNHFGAQSYLDLTAAIRVRDNLTLRAGVNNVLDEEPPLSGLGAAGAFNGNTYPQVYDSIGRYLFASITANF